MPTGLPTEAPTESARATPTEPPTTTPTERASVGGEPVATLTNPDGPDRSDYAPDEYPFFEVAHSLPTFANLWFDDNRRDIHIALTGGVEEAIESIRELVPKDVTVYFHLAEYTRAEVCAARDQIMGDREKLARVGIVITSGGCGNIHNTATIGMSPLNPETVAYMRARYDGPIEYEASGVSTLVHFEPPAITNLTITAIREGDNLGLSTCGHRPFPSVALESAPIDLNSDGAEYGALAEAIGTYAVLYGDLSRLPWLLVEKDQFGATFLADRGDTWLEAPVFAGTGEWVPGVVSYCTPRELTLPDGGNAEVFLDPEYPKPRGEDTELHVLVNETDCSGGTVPYSRLLPPVVRYDPGALRIEVTVRGVGGPATCPGNPAAPVTVLLPEPVGNRDVKILEQPRY